MAVWRVWHPGRYTQTAERFRDFGPIGRFDPHPGSVDGPQPYPGGPWVWYGSLLFDTAVLEALVRPAGIAVVELCSSWRASLVEIDASEVYDLTDPVRCGRLGADPRLGDELDEVGSYLVQQRWARYLRPSAAGVRYFSSRHRASDGAPHGINVGLWDPARVGEVRHQHRLLDDALWPHLVAALDATDVAWDAVELCGRC